jgi:MFS family permease
MEKPRPWYSELNGYHWYVLVIAALGWLFDTMDQQLFVLAKTPALQDLLGSKLVGLSSTDSANLVTKYAGWATTIFIIGWATGGLVFGLIGDRLGRARTMIVTILIYSLFTGLSALSVGWIDFAIYRFLTGMGVGGEFAAGVSLVAEVMPVRARPYALGLLQALSAVGNMTAAALTLIIPPQATGTGMAGWRMLFLVGILPALLVVFIRRGLREPESWKKAKEESLRAGVDPAMQKKLGDVKELFGTRRWLGHMIVGVCLSTAGVMMLWGVGFWIPELVRENVVKRELLQHPERLEPLVSRASASQPETSASTDQAQTAEQVIKSQQDYWAGIASLLQNFGAFFGIYAFSLIAGRFGRRAAFALSFLISWLAIFAVFGFMSERSQIPWMIPILGFCTLMPFGGFAIYFPELFPTRLRATGTGVCYNVARYLAAFAPWMLGQLTTGLTSAKSALHEQNLADFTLLSQWGGFDHAFRYAAILVSMVGIIGLLILPFAPETKDRPLPE